jgi:predicted TIM-barrel fold metal-dependent hydrolase
MAPDRLYTPPAASADELLALQRRLRRDRVVIVQPSFYGVDDAATLEGLRQLGPRRARGVAVIDDKTSPQALDDMDKAGIRGIRLNLETAGEIDPAASDSLNQLPSWAAEQAIRQQILVDNPARLYGF